MSPAALADAGVARIGPNAIHQHLPVLDALIGPALRKALMIRAGVVEPAQDCGMLPEDEVIHLHRAVWLFLPDRAPQVQRAAGLAVGDYILANRIPPPAQWLIRHLPARAGAALLARAIARHAWTFAGSGAFRITATQPLTFEIGQNPLALGPQGGAPCCHWHSAVFERLFARLVWPDVKVIETECCAKGADACRFELHHKG